MAATAAATTFAVDYANKNPDKVVSMAGWLIALIVFVVVIFIVVMGSSFSTTAQQLGASSYTPTTKNKNSKNYKNQQKINTSYN